MYNKDLSFHFVGIGGSGMSGIAEILLRRGFRVSGSDMKSSSVTRGLQHLGAKISIGHATSNISADTSLLVISSAVKEDNVEVAEARRIGLPVVRRAEVLAELLRLKFGIAVAGSHGKTTTTSLIAWILECNAYDPTIIIGGIVQSIGSGGKDGDGQFLVAESDESDRSFLLLRPTISVVTNIDDEHLIAYESHEDLVQSFASFASAVPFYGLAVCCADDPEVLQLSQQLRVRKCLYGFNDQADVRALDVRQKDFRSRFTLVLRGKILGVIDLPLMGFHNCQNALAAIAVALEIGASFQQIQHALQCFPGVKRRLEILHQDEGFVIFSDYAHHPSEIEETLLALQQHFGSIVVVFQPHRFSRLNDCFDAFTQCFSNAHTLIVSDVYSAGESEIAGVNAQSLVNSIQRTRQGEIDKEIFSIEYCKDIELAIGHGYEIALRLASSTDRDASRAASLSGVALVCLGAGSIGYQAEQFVADRFSPTVRAVHAE
jgi:UDP-N-acetylmuramate--alanine ligase